MNYILTFNTLCQGLQPVTENDKPVIYDSYDKLFMEMFEDTLEHLNIQCEEGNLEEGVTIDLINEMTRVFMQGTLQDCKNFWMDNEEVNIDELQIIPADEFLVGQKSIF
jgi:hypothetical protein